MFFTPNYKWLGVTSLSCRYCFRLVSVNQCCHFLETYVACYLFFFNPFDFISSCCRFLWQSLRKLRHHLSPSNWLKVFRTLKLYDNFHVVMTFFAKKRHDIFILGFLLLKPDSNCGRIEGQKKEEKKTRKLWKIRAYVHSLDKTCLKIRKITKNNPRMTLTVSNTIDIL